MISNNSAIADATQDVLNGDRDSGPDGLVASVAFKLRKTDIAVDEGTVLELILVENFNDDTRRAMHLALAQWDAEPDPDWAEGTPRSTAERRERIYSLLELSDDAADRLDTEFPTASTLDTMIVDPEKWDPWYTGDRQSAHDFYWHAYRGVLERKGWAPESIASLSRSTSEIVGRLSDPTAETGYQSKGLVVGHVQSGKTANFTGIVAKAIDSGYRLVIVLTGTIELLRGQTQRRLDMELVGKENILAGANPEDADAVRDIDYISTGDTDWINDNFMSHDVDVHNLPGVPSIKRLTTIGRDYRKLGVGRDTLDFRRTGELRDSAKHVFDPVNIYDVDARIAVMKKNPTALKNLIHDLKNIRADVREIPALIIDDEADQASVNTVNPRSPSAIRKSSAINALIKELLQLLPRAQYVGYTATPFANVFVSPDDSEDIFPKDFIVSLEPSAGYMGGRQFHDLFGIDDADKDDPRHSNEAAFMRRLLADGDVDPEAERTEIRAALDAFVLSGAIKKWRESVDEEFHFRHHTMLVHESVRTAEHSDLASTIRSVWSNGAYSQGAGLSRLRALYADDFEYVTSSRTGWSDLPLPSTFDELKPHIGATLDAIMADGDPVVIVNGSRDSDYNAMDFQVRPYWRVMVGGAKLSRGFTVEGLTVSYYRRRALAADTLMQMGRWFGYRPGYEDLVRLYIARDVVDGKGKSYDLYDAFTSIIEDEEEFREQLRRFAEVKEDGKPVVRPIHVPPMVFQQLPWLRPTGANKMYNAELTYEGDGGEVKDFNAHAYRGDGKNNIANLEAVKPWLAELGEPIDEFFGKVGSPYRARHGVLDTETVLAGLQRFTLLSPDQLSPTIHMIEKASDEGKIEDWVVFVPDLGSDYRRLVDDVDLSLSERRRRPDRPGFAGSEQRHRDALRVVAGEHPGGSLAGPTAQKLASTTTRGALLLTFAIDPLLTADNRDGNRVHQASVKRTNWPTPVTAADVATLLSLALPYRAAPRGRIGFRVRKQDLYDQAIINLSA